MSSRLPIALATAALAGVFSTDSVTGGTGRKLVSADEAQIVDTVSTIFTAALTDDVAKFDSVIASDFYIFDGGSNTRQLRQKVFRENSIHILWLAQRTHEKRCYYFVPLLVVVRGLYSDISLVRQWRLTDGN